VNAERRMPSSSYLAPRRRIVTRQAHVAPEERNVGEPLWRRWYVPWAVAAIAVVGLIIATVAALEIITAVPERPAPLTTPSVEELVSES